MDEYLWFFVILFVLFIVVAAWAKPERLPYRHAIRIPVYRPMDEDC